ncbi:MAG: hypothetical protein H6726_23400 [Sandaracinaceae bacterium]|nr:hypothetical protein [Myxococcales bacterium]MCB9660611.1 hypothetical protein [Sandaracinaceae bacterium]
MALQHRFLAGMNRKTWSLSARVDSADGTESSRRELPSSHPWLAPRAGVLGALHALVARALRFFGYALLASPVLVPVHLVIRPFSPVAAGWAVVAFACLAVAFFATLNAFILLSAIRYAVSTRDTLRLWSRAETDEARTFVFSDKEPYAVRGEVLSIGAPADGDVVVRELVSRARGVRVLEACDFAVYTDAGEYVVVRVEDPPLLLADREPARALALPEGTRNSLAERGIPQPERERSLHVYGVRVGDRVLVVGSTAEPIARVDRFELGGEARGVRGAGGRNEPYRGDRGDSAVLLRCTEREPMLIVREGGP